MERKKILIVDDMQTVIDQAETIIKDKFEVSGATSPAGALRKMEAYIPDIILCDINMPDADGFSLLRSLKEDDRLKDIPVIFMVIETSILTKTKAYEMGVADLITKPFVPKELLRKLELNCKLKEIGWEPEY